ncbi:ATP12 family chaperone protein [Sphingomonas flavescens]|uniref:ATP12 family chaperone protein n=1 Tax=Sphingomonas flavescens TaxID=3132797 RepID=UPI0028064B45|nr:ATP12 family protein [Sphingomonas limnosediminicola]
MKRFWQTVSVERDGSAWGVQLDGRPVKTPARAPLALPNEVLAGEVAEEWRGVGETIDPRVMPFTGLANAAIDRVAPDPRQFAAGLARYAEADLLCYRAEGPHALVARQQERWDPLLGWARRRFDVDFIVTDGVMHARQPEATIEQLAHAVAALDAFYLAGLSPLVTIGGSLIAALAVLEEAVGVEAAWDAVSLDECWQAEQWGADAEAEAALALRRRDFFAGAAFLALLDQ